MRSLPAYDRRVTTCAVYRRYKSYPNLNFVSALLLDSEVPDLLARGLPVYKNSSDLPIAVLKAMLGSAHLA